MSGNRGGSGGGGCSGDTTGNAKRSSHAAVKAEPVKDVSQAVHNSTIHNGVHGGSSDIPGGVNDAGDSSLREGDGQRQQATDDACVDRRCGRG
jgi:hypothetical protein